MSRHDKTIKIMVMLDCLLDTRIGTLAKLNQEAAIKVLQSGKYHTRDCDIFDGFDQEEYRKAYAERDITTLTFSTLTECHVAIDGLVRQLRQQLIDKPTHQGVELIINTYPYVLDEQTHKHITMAMTNWSKLVSVISTEHIPLKRLTPAYCDSRFVGMFFYDYNEWWNIHNEAFKKKLIPNVFVWGPALYFTTPPTEEELAEAMKDKMPHPFVAVELMASVMVQLQLLDIRFFCLPDPTLPMPKSKGGG